jgi:hypothetical protein
MPRVANTLLAAALLALPVLAHAAPAPRANPVVHGAVELSPAVSFNHENLKRDGYGGVDNFTQLDFTPTIGYCITNHYEVTGGMLIQHQSQNGSSATAVGALAGVTYNFNPSGSLVPFAGLGFGNMFDGGFSFDQPAVILPNLTAGLRVLAGGSSSVNLTLGYQRERNDSMRQNRILAGVGVSVFPWGVR